MHNLICSSLDTSLISSIKLTPPHLQTPAARLVTQLISMWSDCTCLCGDDLNNLNAPTYKAALLEPFDEERKRSAVEECER